MARLILPASETVTVAVGPSGNLSQKEARDIEPGDFVWVFVAETYLPTVSGHFKFMKVGALPKIEKLTSYKCNWFNSKDGPEVVIPKEWILFCEGGFEKVSEKNSFLAKAHPGYLHDEIPSGLGFELFSNGFQSSLLTECAAYFLGAFAFRPQCYPVGGDTWGIFGSRINRAGAFGVGKNSKISKKIQANWLKKHRQSIEALATLSWGKKGFLVEQKGKDIGLPDEAIPPLHIPDQFMKHSACGFAIHAPIAKGFQLSSTGKPNDPDLRVIQYWYACLESYLIERSTVSVRKAFLMGALDTGSNADKDRKSIGLDWPEKFSGEFPFYSAIHSVGREVLSTFEGEETQNPRLTKGRVRGRIPRCRIWEEMADIGFISELKAARAIDYEPDITSIPLVSFPTPSALSVVMGVPVFSIGNSSGLGATHDDLTKHKLFRGKKEVTAEYAVIENSDENAFAACSIPLGSIKSPSTATASKAKSKHISLSKSGWEKEALENIFNIDKLIGSSSGVTIPNDMVFEYLIALLVSELQGCREAWVVPRSEDQGVDVGALFDMGGAFGDVGVIFQAKLQGKPVSRRIIDMLRGSLSREASVIGYVVTNNRFTVYASRSAKNDYPEIRLIDGEQLIRLLLQNKVGIFARGGGIRRKVYLDITFFEKVRDLAVSARGKSGKIRVHINGADDPAFVIT